MRYLRLTLFVVFLFCHRSSAQEETTSHAPYLHNRSIAFSISLANVLSAELYYPGYIEVVIPLRADDELHTGFLFTVGLYSGERTVGWDLKYYHYFGIDRYFSAFVDGFIETSTSFPISLRLRDVPSAIQIRSSNIATGAGLGIAYFPTAFLQLSCEERIVFTSGKVKGADESLTLGSEVRFFVRVKFW